MINPLKRKLMESFCFNANPFDTIFQFSLGVLLKKIIILNLLEIHRLKVKENRRKGIMMEVWRKERRNPLKTKRRRIWPSQDVGVKTS